MYIHTSEFVSFKCIQYSTWCQNRGCICISSTRRTYRSNPAVSCIHSVIQTRNIILQTELILQEEGKREIPSTTSQSSTSINSRAPARILQCFHTQSSHPVQGNYSKHRINSSTSNLQEILQLQGSSRAGTYQASSSNCSPCFQAFYMPETLLVTL